MSLFLALTLACNGRSSAPIEPAVEPGAGVVEAAPAEVVPETVPEAVPEATADAAPDVEAAGGEKLADGASCLSGDECSSGTCEGEGCGDDTPGVCMSNDRPCTRDLRPYCGCDGETFRTSGSCPGKRYSARDFCPGDAGGIAVPIPG